MQHYNSIKLVTLIAKNSLVYREVIFESSQDVLIPDSTIIPLLSSLTDKFPAAIARQVASGVKGGIMISAVANEPKIVHHTLKK